MCSPNWVLTSVRLWGWYVPSTSLRLQLSEPCATTKTCPWVHKTTVGQAGVVDLGAQRGLDDPPCWLQQSVQVTLRQRATNVAFTPSSPAIVWSDAQCHVTWTWYGYLPARGLSQYDRNVRRFVRMQRLVAISLPWTYIRRTYCGKSDRRASPSGAQLFLG